MLDTFQCKNSAIWIHQSWICSDWPPQRLHRHVHVDDHHTVLRRRLSDAYVLLRLHRNMRESDELRIYAKRWQLKSNKKSNKTQICSIQQVTKSQILKTRVELRATQKPATSHKDLTIDTEIIDLSIDLNRSRRETGESINLDSNLGLNPDKTGSHLWNQLKLNIITRLTVRASFMVIGAFAAAMTPGSTVPHRRIREKEGQAERKGFENPPVFESN